MGKTPAPRGTDLEVLFAETQKANGGKPGSCQSPVAVFPTRSAPSSFFIVPSKGGTMLNWAVTIQTDTERMAVNNDGKDPSPNSLPRTGCQHGHYRRLHLCYQHCLGSQEELH